MRLKWSCLLLVLCLVTADQLHAAIPPQNPQIPLGHGEVVLTVPIGWSTTDRTVADDTTSHAPGSDATIMGVRLLSPVQADLGTGVDEQSRQRSRGVISVVVHNLGKPQAPAVFGKRCRTDLERLMTAFVLDGDDTMKIAGHAWTRLRYHFNLGRFTWRQEAYITVIGSTGFCLTCSCEDPHFQYWQKTFSQFIDNLELSTPAIDDR